MLSTKALNSGLFGLILKASRQTASAPSLSPSAYRAVPSAGIDIPLPGAFPGFRSSSAPGCLDTHQAYATTGDGVAEGRGAKAARA